ncbi:38421_t:CDS:2 [Gigaspora margarita]|uniref:38421_t:CDS:1 n=1 Tax=Gigaspora margarita TaxID=4874 RepID=A0ABN7UPI8_GIGMA|nr:38421_t:CDS:2 [Gigaspora margarita]
MSRIDSGLEIVGIIGMRIGFRISFRLGIVGIKAGYVRVSVALSLELFELSFGKY